MNRGQKELVVSLLFLSVTLGLSAAENFGALKLEYEVFQKELSKDFESQKAALYDKYAAAVRRRQADFQAQGNLELALEAKAEADLAEEN